MSLFRALHPLCVIAPPPPPPPYHHPVWPAYRTGKGDHSPIHCVQALSRPLTHIQTHLKTHTYATSKHMHFFRFLPSRRSSKSRPLCPCIMCACTAQQHTHCQKTATLSLFLSLHPKHIHASPSVCTTRNVCA